MHHAALRYLVAVARYGSIRKASNELNISASAINRQILMLEEEFGIELFERRASGLKPTMHGDLLIEHARNTLHEFDVVRSEINEMQGRLAGNIRIATLDSLTLHVLPTAIIAFRKDHPDVTFQIETADPASVTRLVSNDSADIGLTFFSEAHSGITILHHVPSPLCAIMHTSHPLANNNSLSAYDCLSYDIILQEDSGSVVAFLGRAMADMRRKALPILVTNTIVASKAMILRGAGIGFFTRLGFIQELETGEVAAIRLSERGPSSLKLATIISSSRRTTRTIDNFVDTLSRVLDEQQFRRLQSA